MNKKEAIEIIKKNWHDSRYTMLREALQTLIPELKESEDERMKRCIGMCLTDATEQRFEDFNTTLKDCLAWIEKQGEQNHTEIDKNSDMTEALRIEYEKGRADAIAEMRSSMSQSHQGTFSPSDSIARELQRRHDKQKSIDAENKADAIAEMKKYIWSEEDEKISNAIYESIDFLCLKSFGFSEDEVCDWLKSLRPRHITYELDAPLFYDKDMNPIYPPINHWKPSEEQMKEYSYWYRNFIESGLASPSSKAVTVLGELLEQLKSL